MRNKLALTLSVLALGTLAVGCAGPTKKLSRGFSNAMEFTRMGEWRRSYEQTYLWDGPNAAYSIGFIKGFNRSLLRTGVGLYEIVTFPIPSYDPVLYPGCPIAPDMTEGPAYPDSYKPNIFATSAVQPDANLGFGGGDVFPFVPGSRFRIYDY